MSSFRLLLLAGLLTPLAVRSEEPPIGATGAPGGTGLTRATTGVDALCWEIATVSMPHLAGAGSVDLEIAAEGAATDIAGELRERCLVILAAAGVKSFRSPFDHTIHVRVRVASPALTALVDVSIAAGPLGSDAVSAPLGPALEAWLSSGGQGVETWLAGSVEGTVLSLCGGALGDQDILAAVEPDSIAFVRWSPRGLTPITRLDLPANVRPHARSPAASSVCRVAEGALTIAFGIHDRGKGGLVRFASGAATWVSGLDGIPIGAADDGALILAEAVLGTNAILWKGRTLAQAVASGTKGAETIVGTTPEGALLLDETLGRPGLVGAGIALADLDHGGTTDLIVTRPVFEAGEDGLSVRSLKNIARIRHQSRDLKELLGAVGLLTDARGVIAVAAAPGALRSQIYGVGQRQAPSKP